MESFHSHDKKSIVNVSSSKKAALSKQLTLASGRGILQSTQRDRTGIARARARVRAIVWTLKCPFWLCDCILTILLPFFCYHLFFNIPTKGSSVEEGVALFHVYRSKYNRTTYFKASTQVFIHAQICVHVWDTSSMDISVGSVLHVVFFGRFPVLVAIFVRLLANFHSCTRASRASGGTERMDMRNQGSCGSG